MKKATDEQLISAYKELGNIWKVADRFRMCGQSVHERLQKLNIPIDGRGKRLSQEEINIVKNYYLQTDDKKFSRDHLLSLLPNGTTISRLEHIVTQIGTGKFGRPKSELQRQHLSEIKKGIKPTHSGFSGFRHTDESKEKISQASKRNWKDPNFAKNTTEGKVKTAEIARRNGLKALNSINTYSRCKRGYYDIPGRGSVYFRSKWEANYALYLQYLKDKKQIISWEYEAKTFDFPVKRGCRFYTPDFFIINQDGKEEHHEVKGWMDKKSKTKIRRMGIHYPDVKFIVIDQVEYKKLQQYSRLLKWY